MENVTLRLINNRKGKGSTKKASAVELRITYMRKAKYVSTGVMVCTNQFKDGKVVKHPDALSLNEKLANIYLKASRVVRKMEEDGFIDLQAIPAMIDSYGTKETFWDYCERQAIAKIGISEATRDRYFTWLDRVKEMNMFRTFTEVNETNIGNFDKILHDEGKEQSTIHSYHKYLKMFIAMAVNDGLLKVCPYKKKNIHIPVGKNGINKYLTEEEVERLRVVELTDCLTRVRDLFVFACYTGLSYSDLMAFDKSKIKDYGKYKMIEDERIKTKVGFFVVLLPQAEEILEKYDYQLPKISNQKYNSYLKIVAQFAKIDKPISSHWARHTAGMTMLNNGVPIEVVSKVLGHSNIGTTQEVYATIKRKMVAKEMLKLQEVLA